MKRGRYGAILVRLLTQVPPMPSANSTSGPTQHTEAPIAANTPAASELFPVSFGTLSDFNQLRQVLLYTQYPGTESRV